jgi:hypothetical protein
MFRFTIRELVLLTLVVALGVGWWVDRSRLERQISSFKSDEQFRRAFDFDVQGPR